MKKCIVVSVIIVMLLCLVGSFFIIFPLKYTKHIKKYASEYDLPASMVASLINIESGYDKHAKSKAGAIGLMQIMPNTAKEIATKFNINYNDEMLYDEETNIKFGCYYLSYLLNYYDLNITNTLASYNWGLNNVNNWINNGNVDKDGSIINIPVSETKNYLKKYKFNNFFYDIFY